MLATKRLAKSQSETMVYLIWGSYILDQVAYYGSARLATKLSTPLNTRSFSPLVRTSKPTGNGSTPPTKSITAPKEEPHSGVENNNRRSLSAQAPLKYVSDIKITPQGVDAVTKHLKTFNNQAKSGKWDHNEIMINRLLKISKGEIVAT